MRDYFAHVAPADLVGNDPTDLIGLVTSHRKLAAQRDPDETKVAVHTPTVNEHGWSCGHTVVQIVADDMPFLVDSASLSITRAGHDLHLLIHPQLVVLRDDGGAFSASSACFRTTPGTWPEGAIAEAWITIEINRESDPAELVAIEQRAAHALSDVRAAVRDWPRMKEVAVALAQELRDAPPSTVDAAEAAEDADFLDWLADDHFTFLGYREYDLVDDDQALRPVPGSSWESCARPRRTPPRSASSHPRCVKAVEPHPLVLTKANTRSTVHRNTYLDYVGVKRFDADGKVVGSGGSWACTPARPTPSRCR